MNVLLKLLTPSFFTAVAGAVSALVGFYVTTVIEEIRSGHSAIYEFEHNDQTGQTLFHLENLSRAKAIEGAEFYIICRDQRPDCFKEMPHLEPHSGSVYVEPITIAPNFAKPVAIGANPQQIRVCLGTIPGAATSFAFTMVDPSVELLALYDPWTDSSCKPAAPLSSSLFLLEPFDFHALAAKYYFDVFSSILIISILILILTGLRSAFTKTQSVPLNSMENSDEVAYARDVTLRPDDSVNTRR